MNSNLFRIKLSRLHFLYKTVLFFISFYFFFFKDLNLPEDLKGQNDTDQIAICKSVIFDRLVNQGKNQFSPFNFLSSETAIISVTTLGATDNSKDGQNSAGQGQICQLIPVFHLVKIKFAS